MKNAVIHFEIPEDILNALNQDITEFTNNSRLITALQFYRSHKLSLGKAAELAGLSKSEFIFELDKHHIPLLDYDPSELENELKRFQK